MESSSKHKWTFNDFVTRIDELSNTPKKFCEVVFKTLIREFQFYSNDSTEYGCQVLKDIFLPDGSILTAPFPDGLVQNLLQSNIASLADEDKTKIRDDEVQQIVENMGAQRQNPPPSSLLFEEVLEKLKAFCQDDLRIEDALEQLEFANDFDCLGAEWIIRILTCTVHKKLKCSKKDMASWLDELMMRSFAPPTRILGEAQSPMLLVKTSYGIDDYTNKIVKFCGDSYYTETKYDGERLQVHKMKNIYRFYSRNGIDYSEKLGKDSSRQFAARIHSLFKPEVTHCIIDCELLVYDRKTEKLVGKNEAASDGKIYDVKNLLETRDEDDRAVTRCLCVFDVMNLNGIDIVNWTLSARRRALEDLFNEDLIADHTLFVSKFTLTMKRKDFIEYYNQAMAERLEGIVIKSLYSTYEFGSRAQGNGWFKIKPDYGSGHTLDLVVAAVRMDNKYGRIQAFEVAALSSKNPIRFRVVGTVTAKLKRLDLNRLIAMLKGEGNTFLNNQPPQWIQRSIVQDKNVKYVALKNLVVVEVRASGIMRGALRFPSIECIRADKDPIDADTVKDFEDFENNIRKIVDADAAETAATKNRKRKIQTSVPAQFKRYHSNLGNADARYICISNLKDSVSSSDLDDLTNLGFNFIPNLTKDCVCVVTDEPKSFKIKSAINQNTCHIIKGDWLKRCRDEGALVAWKPEDIVFNSPNATFSLFENSKDVEVMDSENEEEEDGNAKKDKRQDIVDNDSDPEVLSDFHEMELGEDEVEE